MLTVFICELTHFVTPPGRLRLGTPEYQAGQQRARRRVPGVRWFFALLAIYIVVNLFVDLRPLVPIFAVALVLFVIYRQLLRRPVEGRRLVVVPLILVAVGLYGLGELPPATGAAVTALGASLANAVVFGLARGLSMRVWWDAGGALQQGAPLTVALWAISFALRVGIGALAQRAGVAPSVTLGELPLFLGVTLGAQNLVIWLRAQAIGGAPRTSGRRVL